MSKIAISCNDLLFMCTKIHKIHKNSFQSLEVLLEFGFLILEKAEVVHILQTLSEDLLELVNVRFGVVYPCPQSGQYLMGHEVVADPVAVVHEGPEAHKGIVGAAHLIRKGRVRLKKKVGEIVQSIKKRGSFPTWLVDSLW